jgi:L-ascorbate metabolism protein UlaG (beta-lactamase superfamily)
MSVIRYMGHSVFHLSATGLEGLIDPFLRGNSQACAGPGDFESLTHIFVTHGHGDHLGDTVEIGQKTGATVVANAEICRFLSGKGLKTRPMYVGGWVSFPFGRVKFVPAVHGSGITEAGVTIYGGVAVGIVIEIGGFRIYHAGDTGLTADMGLLEALKIDLALLPIGGCYVMDIADAQRAVELVRPRKVVPMHYGTFPGIEADPGEFLAALPSWVEGILLSPGERVSF